MVLNYSIKHCMEYGWIATHPHTTLSVKTAICAFYLPDKMSELPTQAIGDGLGFGGRRLT